MRFFLSIVSLLCLFAAPAAFAAPQPDLQLSPDCTLCGMDRAKFNFSRMVIEYEDGSSIGVCSLHCAAVELANTIDKVPVMVRVADYDSKELIDAYKAVWVIGGNTKGVMTVQAKWAFADKGAAERFVKANGGKIASFDEAIKAAYDDMYQDTKRIREYRKMKHMKHHGGEAKH